MLRACHTDPLTGALRMEGNVWEESKQKGDFEELWS